jgi:hypothetical protein
MSNGREFDKPGVYQIRVKGTLNERWSDWFGGFSIVPQANNQTLLTGSVTDQISLHGLLSKIRDLGLPLVSVNHVEPDSEETLGK